MAKPFNILLLADKNHPTAAVHDHIHAITNHSSHHWFVENPLVNKTLHKLDFTLFDAIGIHYSIKPYDRYYLYERLFNKLKEYQGAKFLFLQDEYQYADLASEAMAQLNMQVLFTLVKPSLHRQAYPDLRLANMKIVSVLTAYVPTHLLQITPPSIQQRNIDIFYRSRLYDYRLGRLAQERKAIAEGVLARAAEQQLTVDIRIQEEDRIYGTAWIEKHCQAKAVLATESGASIWDASGEIAKRVKSALKKNPQASFDHIEKTVLQPYEGNLLYNAISPRIFEAIALKTALVMFPGEYNGICIPDQHFIQLEKDFSNFTEVAAKIKDTHYLQALVDRAYADLILSEKYHGKNLAKTVDLEVGQLLNVVSNIIQLPSHITNIIEKNKQQYAKYNVIYNGIVEMKFFLKNGFMIIFDPSVTLKTKIKKLIKGIKRYLVYLTARYQTTKTTKEIFTETQASPPMQKKG